MFALVLMIGTAHAWVVKTNSKGDELHWDTTRIEYLVNPDTQQDIDPIDVEDVVDSAAQQWVGVPGVMLSLRDDGLSEEQTINYEDNVNLVFFEDDWELSSTLLAVTYVWSVGDGQIQAFDMTINDRDYGWDVDGGDDQNDLMNSITHEFGHVLGLDHTQVDQATMFGSTFPGELSKRDLELDDQEAIQYLYGDAVPLPNSAGCAQAAGHPANILAFLATLLTVGWRRSDPLHETQSPSSLWRRAPR